MLTIPASTSKRKQACISCRQRKKRCDGVRPDCSLCRKFGLQCKYTLAIPGGFLSTIRTKQNSGVLLPVLAQKDLNEYVPHSPSSGYTEPATANSSSQVSITTSPDLPVDYPTRDSAHGMADADEGMDMLHMTQLPTLEALKELVNIFFDQLYDDLPCFHKQKFMGEIESGYLQKEAPLVLYALCCLAARRHTDARMQERQKEWYELAKLSYELTTRTPYQGLRAIQAVLLLIYHATTIGDFSADWLFLGKAWRQAVALGLNRLDSSHVGAGFSHKVSRDTNADSSGLDNEIKTVVEQEECRRTLWLLFMLDRGHAWPTAWPNAISELHFKVNIPLPETVFQGLDPRLRQSPFENAIFTTNFNNLITPSSAGKGPLNILYYLAAAHVLLGRVAELIHSLHDAPYTPEYANRCNELDSFIVKFRLGIPRRATSVLEASTKDRQQAIWLNLVLNTIEILLHYRCSVGVPVSDASSQFALAVAAARNTTRLIKDASRVSVDLLLSAHFGAPLYLAACVLVIEWNATKDASLRDDIGLFESVFDRMSEVFLFFGLKFKIALDRELTRSEEGLRAMRAQGAQGLLADCSKWQFVKDEIERRGIDIQIS